MDFELTHTFNTDLKTYEGLLLDPELPAFLEENCPDIEKIEVQSLEDDGTTVRRKVLYRPKPGAYKVGPQTVPTRYTVFVEESTYNRNTRYLTFENFPQIPAKLKPKFSNTGSMTLTERGGRVQRVIKGQINVKIFMVGKIAEKIVYKAGASLIEQEAAAMAKFIEHKK